MAIVVTKEIKKKRILLVVAGGLIAASFLVIYFGVYYQPSMPSAEQSGVPTASLSKSEVDINLGVFDDERFKSLQISPGVPIATDTPGKSNPFSE